ncbi:class I SAM-dependent methyltransferase [Roseibium sp. LAB1]
MTTLVQDHYGASDIVSRILAAIPWLPEEGKALTADQLFAYDQLHGRELQATKDHAARLNPGKAAHVLDIGSGIGGPARYVASTFGCHVTGIDLTPEFIAAADELTSLCGLSDLSTFVLGDAATIPFEAAAFDHAYCFYVGMNLIDKPAVLSECLRVLKPGGILLWTEVTSVVGTPYYPLPWSLNAEGSHVDTLEALKGQMLAAGFEIVSVDDETGAHLELAKRMKSSGVIPSAGQKQANEVVLGPDFLERRVNYLKSLSEGRIASTLLVAKKPG